jgi:hypothetical protein
MDCKRLWMVASGKDYVGIEVQILPMQKITHSNRQTISAASAFACSLLRRPTQSSINLYCSAPTHRKRAYAFCCKRSNSIPGTYHGTLTPLGMAAGAKYGSNANTENSRGRDIGGCLLKRRHECKYRKLARQSGTN